MGGAHPTCGGVSCPGQGFAAIGISVPAGAAPSREFQRPRLCGPNASGRRWARRVVIVDGPSHTESTSASGPNSLITWRQAPQGAVGSDVGVKTTTARITRGFSDRPTA